MKRKSQNKSCRARVVTLVIVFRNIYQMFSPITLLKDMSITNEYVASNYCLINSVITGKSPHDYEKYRKLQFASV